MHSGYISHLAGAGLRGERKMWKVWLFRFFFNPKQVDDMQFSDVRDLDKGDR